MSEIAATREVVKAELDKSTRHPLLWSLLFFAISVAAVWLGEWPIALPMMWASGAFLGHGGLKHRVLDLLQPAEGGDK